MIVMLFLLLILLLLLLLLSDTLQTTSSDKSSDQLFYIEQDLHDFFIRLLSSTTSLSLFLSIFRRYFDFLYSG